MKIITIIRRAYHPKRMQKGPERQDGPVVNVDRLPVKEQVHDSRIRKQ
jgi:hypothetical protein